MRYVIVIIVIFLIWRIFLFVPLFAGHNFLPYRSGYEYTSIWKFTQQYKPVDHFLLYPWANFDGVHYLRIAGAGYSNNGGFFPLYPLLIHVLSLFFGTIKIFGKVEFFSALFVSNVFSLLSLVVFYKLLRIDYLDGFAKKIIFFLLVFPTAFFFGSVYTESIFLLLSLLAFLCARKGKWLFAGLFGGLLSATRIVGNIILPALIIEYMSQKKARPLKAWPLALVPLGLLIYMWFSLEKWNNAFYFVKAQGMLLNNRSVNSIILFPQTLIRYCKILLTLTPNQYEFWIAILEFFTFFFVAVLLYIAWKNKVRVSYLVFSVFCFLIPVSSGTFSGLPRYALVLFPIFIALAFVGKKMQMLYIILSIILLFILLMLFSRGYFVA